VVSNENKTIDFKYQLKSVSINVDSIQQNWWNAMHSILFYLVKRPVPSHGCMNV